VGDASGRVSVLAQTMFQDPSAVLMILDSEIVQLDSAEEMLLVSTHTRSYVCDTERGLFKQVNTSKIEGLQLWLSGNDFG